MSRHELEGKFGVKLTIFLGFFPTPDLIPLSLSPIFPSRRFEQTPTCATSWSDSHPMTGSQFAPCVIDPCRPSNHRACSTKASYSPNAPCHRHPWKFLVLRR